MKPLEQTQDTPLASRPQPVDRESPFSLDDLFFSSTDLKGFITFGNDVFVRVSEYRREQLIGAPHRIIRHPDMPRAVFQLLWDALHAGKGIAAYVKNMSATGSYYWVLAIVTPIESGYLSIRLKPSSSFFAAIPDLYARLRKVEDDLEAAGQSKFKAIEASTRLLHETLPTLGFASYDAFAQTALLSEVCARRAVVERSPVDFGGLAGNACSALSDSVSSMFGQLEVLSKLQHELVENTSAIRNLVASLRRLAVNAHISAMQLLDSGVTLEVVADHINRCSQRLSESTQSLAGSMANADRTLLVARSAIATGDLSVEMMIRFLREQRSQSTHGSALHVHIDQLAQVVSSRLGEASMAAEAVSTQIAQLNSELESFRKQIRTLEILHITGKAESVRVANGTHVSTILDDVHQATLQARQRLNQLTELMASIQFRPPNMDAVSKLLGTLH